IALLFFTPFLNRLSTKTKSVWFFILLPGEIQVCCAVLFCWNQVFVTNKLCFLQKLISLSPFSFRVPNPYGPMIFSSLPLPTFPLKSPSPLNILYLSCIPLRFDPVSHRIGLFLLPLRLHKVRISALSICSLVSSSIS